MGLHVDQTLGRTPRAFSLALALMAEAGADRWDDSLAAGAPAEHRDLLANPAVGLAGRKTMSACRQCGLWRWVAPRARTGGECPNCGSRMVKVKAGPRTKTQGETIGTEP